IPQKIGPSAGGARPASTLSEGHGPFRGLPTRHTERNGHCIAAKTARDLPPFSTMTKIRVARHAVHPMLVVFPLVLLGAYLAWVLAYLTSRNPMGAQISFWTIIAGLIGAVLAAAPRFLDWLSIPDGTRAKRIGIYHLVANVVVLLLFVSSAAARFAHGY